MSDLEVREVTPSINFSPFPQFHCNIVADNIFSLLISFIEIIVFKSP